MGTYYTASALYEPPEAQTDHIYLVGLRLFVEICDSEEKSHYEQIGVQATVPACSSFLAIQTARNTMLDIMREKEHLLSFWQGPEHAAEMDDALFADSAFSKFELHCFQFYRERAELVGLSPST